MHPLNKKVKFMKDSIDFGSMEIPKLFRKLLIPTVLGMVFSAVFVITDGIFVGQGIGSDALAAVNITAPLFLISTGIGLLCGWEVRNDCCLWRWNICIGFCLFWYLVLY